MLPVRLPRLSRRSRAAVLHSGHCIVRCTRQLSAMKRLLRIRRLDSLNGHEPRLVSVIRCGTVEQPGVTNDDVSRLTGEFDNSQRNSCNDPFKLWQLRGPIALGPAMTERPEIWITGQQGLPSEFHLPFLEVRFRLDESTHQLVRSLNDKRPTSSWRYGIDEAEDQGADDSVCWNIVGEVSMEVRSRLLPAGPRKRHKKRPPVTRRFPSTYTDQGIERAPELCVANRFEHIAPAESSQTQSRW